MTDSLTVYISGPMSGYEDYNKPAFAEAADFLRQQGYEVVSPPELNMNDPVGSEGTHLSYQGYLARDMQAMLDRGCNTICLLRGWNDSHGARAELQIAWAIKMGVWYYDEIDRRIIDMGRHL